MNGGIDTHRVGNHEKDKYAVLLDSITVSIRIAVCLWLCYFLTPLAPFYSCGGRILGHNDRTRFVHVSVSGGYVNFKSDKDLLIREAAYRIFTRP